MWIFLIILIIIFAVGIIKLKKDAISVPDEHIVCLTGGVGTGKTYTAVNQTFAKYRQLLRKYKLSKIPLIRRIFKLKGFVKPTLYSNIPLKTGKKHPVHVFKIEHITGVEYLPENCVCLIDEFGQLANQNEFSNILVKENMQFIVRFFRHFTNGYLYITDQSFNNIAVPVRRRINTCFNLQEFKRAFFFIFPLPFAKISCQQLINTDDNLQMQSARLIENYDYFLLPLPYFKTKKNTKYNSRCYKPIYHNGFYNFEKNMIWNYEDGTTCYLADVNTNYSSLVSKKNGLKGFKQK